jgi:hypothetical protein
LTGKVALTAATPYNLARIENRVPQLNRIKPSPVFYASRSAL